MWRLVSTLRQTSEELEDACGDSPGLACRKALEWTSSEDVARGVDWVIERPLRILFIIALGWLANRLARRLVDRVSLTVRNRTREAREYTPKSLRSSDAVEKRADARAQTVASVLGAALSVLIWTIVGLLILGELDVNLAPLIAGAGIAGIAIGFGAQSLVKDVLAGFFMLVEDQYGVDDIVDLEWCEGTVEQVGLRTTQLRDVYGVAWYVPNGEIHRVGNKSQHWARALLDIDVAYGTDLRRAQDVIRTVAMEMWQDPDWGGEEIAGEPELWGVQALGPDAVSIRVVMKTEPATQWAVEREFRLRVKEALDEAGIEIPFPQRTVWLRDERVS